MNDQPSWTTGEGLLRLLARHGVDTAFGVPGNHTVALYRAFDACGIRHVTCRHEQGAAFMADGYARATGRPGVCVLISGPGLLNAATGIAQALADSVPMLVISGVAPIPDLGMNRGSLHELPHQQAAAASFCRTSHTLLDPANLENLVARAFAVFASQRPGPVHIEIPLNLMDAPMPPVAASPPQPPAPPAPDPDGVEQAIRRIRRSETPLLLVGGGARHAAKDLVRLAEALDSPVMNTVNGKGICPASHPLAVGGSPSLPCLRRAMAEADLLIAVGTELGETDYDLLMAGPLPAHPNLIRLDIDPDQLLIPHPPALGLVTDAGSGARALLAALSGGTAEPAAGSEPGTTPGARRAEGLRANLRAEPHHHPDMQAFFGAIRRAAPDAIVVGDSTRPTYYAAWQLETERPGRYFHSVSGFGTLGYALPAAIGAALGSRAAEGHGPVLALIGDGGFQFTVAELATAADLGLPLPVIVWQNQGYREIENSMRAQGVPTASTLIPSLHLPAAASACRARYADPTTLADLEQAISDALDAHGPTLIEVREEHMLSRPSGDWYA